VFREQSQVFNYWLLRLQETSVFGVRFKGTEYGVWV
jgi:hypothetical protein